MKRTHLVAALLAAFVLCGLITYRPAAQETASPKEKGPAAKAAAPASKHASVRHIQEKLNGKIKLKDGISFDANTPLREALGFLSDIFDLTIMIDEAAFKAADPELDVVVAPVRLPKMTNVQLKRIFQLLVKQIPDGAYVVRPDHLEITTRERRNAQFWPERWAQFENHEHPDLPIVDVNFQKQPLDEALLVLEESTGINFVVDPRVDAKAKTLVTARLDDVPLTVAVRVLVNMADLRAVPMGNVYYITSKENAEALQEERQTVPLYQALAAYPPIGASGGLAGLGGGGGGFLGGIGFQGSPVSSQGFDNNIVLDVRVADRAKTRVPANLGTLQGSVEALRLHADMAGLKVVKIDKAYYVTDKENATELQKEEDERAQKTKEEDERAQKANETREKTQTAVESEVEQKLQKKVSINLNRRLFQAAVKDLARHHDVNIVVDPPANRQAERSLTLELKDVPLENCVQVMAELVGLKVVRLNQVLMVTTAERADKMRGPTESARK